MAEWYELSFGDDYLLVYKHRDAQGAKHEVQRMINWLKPAPGAKVLDLCCGMGRHSLALAEAGYRVTGVDLSEVLLREAKRLDTEGRVTWHQADMRRLPLLNGEFDAVVNLFTSFGYFREDVEQIKALQEAARVLKPGGRLLLDFLNPAYTAVHLSNSNGKRRGSGLWNGGGSKTDIYLKTSPLLPPAGSRGITRSGSSYTGWRIFGAC
ncbi:hypothetical protein HMSSN139_16890 [Paenibacillus sp. HMSSN-139]|nr:hypothetical protein HMSSN139_16890 [Paenibacillus sp. HMSSN-139]